MYICLCNALTDQDVRRAAEAGAGRPREVYEHCQARAECGTCTGTVLCVLRRLMAERRDTALAEAH